MSRAGHKLLIPAWASLILVPQDLQDSARTKLFCPNGVSASESVSSRDDPVDILERKLAKMAHFRRFRATGG